MALDGEGQLENELAINHIVELRFIKLEKKIKKQDKIIKYLKTDITDLYNRLGIED